MSAVVQGVVLRRLPQREVLVPVREADRARAARPHQAQRVRRSLQGDVQRAARALVPGDPDGAHARLLVTAVGLHRAVQGQQSVEEDVLVREAAELLVHGVALRHLHVLAGQLVGRLGVAVAVAPERGVGLEEELLADAQQPERRPLRGDRPGAAVGLQPHVEGVRVAPGLHRAVQAHRAGGLGGRGGLGVDLVGGELAQAVGARVGVLAAASRQPGPRHGQGAHGAQPGGPADSAPGSHRHRWDCLSDRADTGPTGVGGEPTGPGRSVPGPVGADGASPSGPAARAMPIGTG